MKWKKQRLVGPCIMFAYIVAGAEGCGKEGLVWPGIFASEWRHPQHGGRGRGEPVSCPSSSRRDRRESGALKHTKDTKRSQQRQRMERGKE